MNSPFAASDSRIAMIVIVDPGDLTTMAKLREILGEDALLYMQAADAPSCGQRTLTERQATILQLLGQGLSNKEIGRTLSISHFTVRNHVSHLLRIFEVQTRKELFRAPIHWRH